MTDDLAAQALAAISDLGAAWRRERAEVERLQAIVDAARMAKNTLEWVAVVLRDVGRPNNAGTVEDRCHALILALGAVSPIPTEEP